MASNLHTEFQVENLGQAFASQSISAFAGGRAPSLVVKDDDLPRTVARYRNGASGPELKRLSDAAHFIERRGSAVFVTIELRSEGAETEIRELGDKLKNHVVKFQRDHGCPAYWVEVLEPTPSIHSHLIAAAPKGHVKRMIESIEASSIFGSEAEAKAVRDMTGLSRYLSKTATPQAAWKRLWRVPGSHRMEGDRVRLSRELERDMIAAGVGDPFRRTYARRFSVPQIVYRDNLFEPLPVLVAPRPKLTLRKRLKHEPMSLPLQCAPTIADMLAELGPTHEVAGERAGLSRPQVTNIINRQFGISREAAKRVLELARAA